LRPIGLAQDTLDHQRVDMDKADLQQVQRQHGEFGQRQGFWTKTS
jgi:hypothetical protein